MMADRWAELMERYEALVEERLKQVAAQRDTLQTRVSELLDLLKEALTMLAYDPPRLQAQRAEWEERKSNLVNRVREMLDKIND